MDDRGAAGVLGASSLVGGCVISLLAQAGRRVAAFSRSPSSCTREEGVTWLQLPASLPPPSEASPISEWVCVAPIWVLPQYFEMIERYGARRVVALSSTSLFVKADSSDRGEQDTARRLAEGEQALQIWAEARGVGWVLLRPTLIYGHGRDKNVTEIARFVRRWGFFPILGDAYGLRQPVHVEDVAMACVSSLTGSTAANRTYTISGGETLPYREMVSRVFHVFGKKPCLVRVPRWLFRWGVAVMQVLAQDQKWTTEMADRMNRDLVFDHADAVRDFGFSPRPFRLSREDVPA